MKVILNRSKQLIIDYNTPFCVIQEIMHCLGEDIELNDVHLNLDKIINYMHTSNIEIDVLDNYTEISDLVKISIFTSQKETKWDYDKLQSAFKHINTFNGDIPTEFVYGPKTNSNPFSYDATMLYEYCIINNINTQYTDNLDELAMYVRLSFADRAVLLDSLVRKIVNLNVFGVINMLKSIDDNTKQDYSYTSEKSSILTQGHTSREVLTNSEAIITATKRFCIDITESSCPAYDIIELLAGNKIINNNDGFSLNYNNNPLYYNMTEFWKPALSHLYTDKMITTLLNNECVNHNEITDPKQFLYELSVTKNIYQGIIPSPENEETFIYKTPVDDINKKHVISYGIMNTKDMIILTPEEMSKFFRIHLDFRDFMNEGEMISDRNIKKIISICRKFPHEDKHQDLLRTINDIKVVVQLANGKMREFITHARKCDNSIKIKIDSILQSLFNLGMHMRGWDGKGPYPLKRESCTNYSERYTEIEIKVIESTKEIIAAINILPDSTKIIIKTLPLIKLNERDKSYYRNTNSDEGLTFYDRLTIILENPSSIYACLRLSSNYLASTAQYYNTIMNNKQFCNITELDYIQ